MRCPSLWAGGSCVVRGAMVCGEAAGGGAEAPRTDRGAAAFPPRAASWGGHCVRNRSARGMRARQTRCGCTAGAMRARACPRGAGPRGRRMRGRAPARRGRGSRGPSAAHPRQRRRPSRPCHLSCGICAHAQPWGHGGGARSAWGRRPVGMGAAPGRRSGTTHTPPGHVARACRRRPMRAMCSRWWRQSAAAPSFTRMHACSFILFPRRTGWGGGPRALGLARTTMAARPNGAAHALWACPDRRARVYHICTLSRELAVLGCPATR